MADLLALDEVLEGAGVETTYYGLEETIGNTGNS